ncbi:MAG: single-stranded-DNA-specific exonuclease RecJ [Bacillota bacterium]|nr:single-stranded-DNA-specific exonuclease RecJ [Bacillota bacterium]
MPSRQWIFLDEKTNRDNVSELAKKLGCSRLFAQILANRGIKSLEEASEFLKESDTQWGDPFLLPDMEKALNRIKYAIKNGEKITVYGDYDVDGITSCVIMASCLSRLGVCADVYIPNRITEGYGFNRAAIDNIKAKDTNLIISVDCGISSKADIEYARQLGIDVIVTDHHNCPDILPICSAVINPKIQGCIYPFKDLAGVGVTYKLACALLGIDSDSSFLELASLGTVADLVSLRGENRRIVKEGLTKINSGSNLGVKALLNSAKNGEITASALSYIIAPRINSAGRMDDPIVAYNLLSSEDFEEAQNIALKLEALNKDRQNEEHSIFEEAVAIIKEQELYRDDVIVVCKEGWNPGVIGIAASKITEKAYKPCIIVSYDENGNGKGSGRSIESFNLFDALKCCSDNLDHFGGHAQAAGVAFSKEQEPLFRGAINQYAKEHINDEMRIKKIYIETQVLPEDITVENINAINKLEPFGTDNPAPVFALVNVKIADMRILSEGKHLKFSLEKDGFYIDGIAFGFGYLSKKLYTGKKIHAAGELSINDYNGKPQLVIKDILY